MGECDEQWRAVPGGKRPRGSAGVCACADGLLDRPEVRNLDGVAVGEEFSREAASLSWPDGFPIPSPRYQEMDHPTVPGRSPGRAQPGVGMSDADSAWFCAWENYYLQDPTSHADKVVTQLRGLHAMHMYQVASDANTREYFDNIVSSLELGDAGLLHKDVEANCTASSGVTPVGPR